MAKGIVDRLEAIEVQTVQGDVVAVALHAAEGLFDLVRWGGCRPPQTASQCAKVVVLRATERKGR